jgi:hypothetical protein
MEQVGPRDNLHAPAVFVVRHHDEWSEGELAAAVGMRADRSPVHTSHSHAEFVPHAVQMRLAC